MPNGQASSHLFRPKLATLLAEGYRLADLRKDAVAGLTVAIVALPLSMAIAVASGVSPDRGLFAAIVGGFLVSALGGSRYQVGGPAGAFIVLVAATVARFGIDGLLLTVLMSGGMLVLIGVLRLGVLIRFIPHTVTIGFTAGIAVTILASQLRDLAGLRLSGPEPGALLPKLAALFEAGPTLNGVALTAGIGVVAGILILRHLRPAWPGMLIALVTASGAAALFGLPLETIGDRFGGLPQSLPSPRLPEFSAALALAVLPSALAFTLLGGIESLLSAKVADRMTGRVHRSNMELVAQGIANVGSALFGGLPVTGTIARTATNIRAGARSPVAGILHAALLLAFMLVAAPLASFVPLAALAGVLVVVAWTMAEVGELRQLMGGWRSGAVVLTTLGLTVLHDLVAGIVGGCILAGVFWAMDRTKRTRA